MTLACSFWEQPIYPGSSTTLLSGGTAPSLRFGQSDESLRFEKRIYIPLPGPEARRRMFEIHVGNTPCELTPKDYKTLADGTEGYSGSDISIVVRDALMQPVRKVISATHFKRVKVDGADKWTPCSPGDPDAVEKTWSDIESDELLEPPLRVADFLKSLDSTRPTVTQADIQKHDEWTKESGMAASSILQVSLLTIVRQRRCMIRRVLALLFCYILFWLFWYSRYHDFRFQVAG